MPDSRRRFLAMKWMITAAREQNGPKDAKMYNKLAKELLDAYNEEVMTRVPDRGVHLVKSFEFTNELLGSRVPKMKYFSSALKGS